MRGIFESLIVFGVMTGLLLPARLLFVEYVSDNWFGSLGIISAISILIIILVKKKKMGFFGLMFERQMYKFQKGKRGILVFGESLFVLLVLGSMIFAIDQGNTAYSELKIQDTENIPLVNNPTANPEQILEPTKEWGAYDWFIAFLMVPMAFLTVFPQMSAAIASIDQILNGWLLHFYTVGFVEYLELLGIFTYYKISFRRKSELPTAQVRCTKAAI